MKNLKGYELPEGAEQVYLGVRVLAGACDGARAQDGVGFNGTDAEFGRSIAIVPLEQWSSKMVYLAWNMTRKYKKQLAGYGIDHDAIPVPPKPNQAVPQAPGRPTAPVPTPGTPLGFIDAGRLAGLFDIRFPYDALLVAAVKEVPGRRWDGILRVWTVPATPPAIEGLRRFAAAQRFGISDRAQALIAQVEAKQPKPVERPAAPTITVDTEDSTAMAAEVEAMIAASRAESADLEIPGLGGTLRPFQCAGVSYVLKSFRTGTGCMIADQMGLGKTPSGLAVAQALETIVTGKRGFPCVIVAPAAVKHNWRREAEKWLPGRTVSVLNGQAWPNYSADVIILNYDILTSRVYGPVKENGKRQVTIEPSAHLRALIDLKPALIILDESHYIKEPKAIRSKMAADLAKAADHVLCLSGTPFVNRPDEGIQQLKVMGRLEAFGGWRGYTTAFCGAFRDRFGWNTGGAKNLDRLNRELRALCYVRRVKADVLKELPAKQRVDLTVDLSNREEYKRAETDLINWIKEQAQIDRAFLGSIAHLDIDEQAKAKSARAQDAAFRAMKAEHLVRIEKLKQLSATGKLVSVVNWAHDFLGEPDEKLIIFATHRAIVHAMADALKAPVITGDTPPAERTALVARFQEDPACRVIVCNMKAGGIGITLTAARTELFVELGWTPSEHDQAEDRAHRIGQENKVTIYYFLAENSIDQDIFDLIEDKRGVVDAATDGGSDAQSSILNDLVDRLASRGAA